jgi:hypothetical protein
VRIDHQIAVLRSDAALQRCTQAPMSAAKEAWVASPVVAPLLAEIRHFGEGAALGQLQLLQRIMHDYSYAQKIVGDWTGRLCDALYQNALGQVPFQHAYSDGFAAIRLAGSGRAALSLIVYEPVDKEIAHTSASFADREQVELAMSGDGKVNIHRLCGEKSGETKQASVRSEKIALKVGMTVDSSGPHLARQICDAGSSLVLLQLTREAAMPQPSREIRLSDGALIHQSCGHKRSSQFEMAAAVLGAMQREDAAGVLTEMALDKGPDNLRWECLRQSLTLDASRGFEALTQIAQSTHDELAIPAVTLRDHLQGAYPVLEAKRATSCPK